LVGASENGLFAATSSHRKDSHPYSRRSSIFEAQLCELKLIFSNAMHRFESGDRNGRIPEAFEARHRIDSGFDVATILLDQVIQVLRRSQRRVLGQQLVSLHFAHCAMRGRIAVQRDGFRSEPLTLDRFREESPGSSDIAPDAEPDVDCLSRSINGTVKLDPFTTDFHLSLIDAP
jgi:hypothetical protein